MGDLTVKLMLGEIRELGVEQLGNEYKRMSREEVRGRRIHWIHAPKSIVATS